ncbi:MAG: restriction endonuclease subunit S [Arcobacteraceae bacterium]|nr:restriction endonuclease subunit S [Arcobacteraceae bacterium]
MSNWQKVNLDKLCFFEKGKTGLAKAIPGDYPLVTTSAERKTNDSYQFDTKAVCIPLVSSTGHGHASLNYVHYQEGKFALGTILVALIPKDETILNAQFLHLYLSRLKDMILVPLMSGAANVSLSISKIKTVEIPLPPIDEQLKIVELFKNLVNENNELVEEINTQQFLLKQLKQTILQEAIEGKLTAKWRAKNPDIGTAKELLDQIKIEKEKLIKEKKLKASKPLAPINEDEIPFDIPQSWEWCRLGEVCNYGSSSKIEPKDIKEDTWILDLEDIEKESSKLLCKIRGNERNSSSTKSVFHQFDVLYSKLRPYLDKVIVADENGVCTTEILPLTFYINIDSYYAMYALKRKDFLKYVNSLTKGMKMPRLGTDDGKNALFPLPPLEEQKEIVATIEKFFAICDELEAEINQNKTKVDNLMATVLKEAFEN